MVEPLIVKENDARRLLGNISRSTMYRWQTTGVIAKPLKINGQNFYQLDELKELIDSSAQGEA